MNFEELQERKSNIFEHVLYEFQMYFETYFRLRALCTGEKKDNILKDIVLESHAVHLRNLIEFFNRDQNCITTETIFKGDHDLSFDDSTIKAKQFVNKTIDHLTKERYTWIRTENDLTVRGAFLPSTMFFNFMASRIVACVDLLLQETEVRPEFIDALHADNTQQRLEQLANVCDKLRGVVQ